MVALYVSHRTLLMMEGSRHSLQDVPSHLRACQLKLLKGDHSQMTKGCKQATATTSLKLQIHLEFIFNGSCQVLDAPRPSSLKVETLSLNYIKFSTLHEVPHGVNTIRFYFPDYIPASQCQAHSRHSTVYQTEQKWCKIWNLLK